MKPIKDWDNVKEPSSTRESLPAGGYVCEILKAAEKPNKQSRGTHLELMIEICEGERRGFFTADYNAQTGEQRYWGGVVNQNIPDELSDKYAMQASFFRRFTNAVEDSNPGYHWDWNEAGLKGKKIGVIFAAREKESAKGTIYTVTNADSVVSVDTIRSGKFTVPELKKLERKTSSGYGGAYNDVPPHTDADLPAGF